MHDTGTCTCTHGHRARRRPIPVANIVDCGALPILLFTYGVSVPLGQRSRAVRQHAMVQSSTPASCTGFLKMQLASSHYSIQ
jgi:hypothetical protein